MQRIARTAEQGTSRNSDLNLILWDLAQQSYLNESSRLAQVVQEEMNRATGVLSRGVKQAPFRVLVGATMPAALVEVGFISNPDEEKKLTDGAFQDTLVAALTRGSRDTRTNTRFGWVWPHRRQPPRPRRWPSAQSGGTTPPPSTASPSPARADRPGA